MLLSKLVTLNSASKPVKGKYCNSWLATG